MVKIDYKLLLIGAGVIAIVGVSVWWWYYKRSTTSQVVTPSITNGIYRVNGSGNKQVVVKSTNLDGFLAIILDDSISNAASITIQNNSEFISATDPSAGNPDMSGFAKCDSNPNDPDCIVAASIQSGPGETLVEQQWQSCLAGTGKYGNPIIIIPDPKSGIKLASGNAFNMVCPQSSVTFKPTPNGLVVAT